MKYARLTKEQFEELYPEFINFLATQTITAGEWKKIKNETPHLAEQELDIFSDLIWEGVLNNTKYLENNSPQELFLFKISEEKMDLIAIKILDSSKDITTPEDFKWLQQSITSDDVSIYKASKPFSKEKNEEVFQLIQQGAEITNGKMYEAFKEILST